MRASATGMPTARWYPDHRRGRSKISFWIKDSIKSRSDHRDGLMRAIRKRDPNGQAGPLARPGPIEDPDLCFVLPRLASRKSIGRMELLRVLAASTDRAGDASSEAALCWSTRTSVPAVHPTSSNLPGEPGPLINCHISWNWIGRCIVYSSPVSPSAPPRLNSVDMRVVYPFPNLASGRPRTEEHSRRTPRDIRSGVNAA